MLTMTVAVAGGSVVLLVFGAAMWWFVIRPRRGKTQTIPQAADLANEAGCRDATRPYT